MNYQEALSCLKAASVRGSRMGLERISELMRRLGDPQNAVKIIHIAGTNGKGSVGAMLASVLTAAGYRTGHFSSPALVSERDFFRIDTEEISEELFAQTFTDVMSHAERMPDPPTEYELLAAMAYTLFARQSCDISVIECCMGGDTDCTNVIDKPLLSVITNVELDHCAFLGNTISEIAAHKAGIIKQGCPILWNGSASAMVPVLERAKALDAPLYHAAGGNHVMTDCTISLDGTDFTYREKKMHLPLLGKYQLDNVQLVLRAVEILQEQGVHILPKALRRGLAHVRWHGRFEVLCRNPVVIFDGAHNPDGMRAALSSFRQYFPEQKAVFLLGVMADKAYTEYPALLKDHAQAVFAVKPDNPRALDAGTLAAAFTEYGIPAEGCDILHEGVRKAFDCARKEHLPLVAFGSLYMYKEFCEALQKIL